MTPNPPDTDPTSPYEHDSKKFHEAAERALDFHFPSNADIKTTLLGISNSITMAEITANRVLDRIEPPA